MYLRRILRGTKTKGSRYECMTELVWLSCSGIVFRKKETRTTKVNLSY